MKRGKCLVYTLIILVFLSFLGGCEKVSETGESRKKVNGVTESEIVIGSSLALEGHASYLGTQTLHGAMAYINFINDKGGIFGRKIRVVSYDDSYDPTKCLVNTQKLILNDKVFMLFCYVGTPTTVKIIPLVEEAKIPLLGMFTGANALRDPLNRYLINIRASYYQETSAAVNHLVNGLGIRRVAVFYQYDAYGFDGLKGTEIALKKYGLVPVATGTYLRGTLDIEEGLEKILEANAEAVVMIGTYNPCAKFIKMARAKGGNAIYYNVSFVGAKELARRLGREGDGVLMTQVVPPPEQTQSQTLLKGVKEYIALLKYYYPDEEPGFVGLEGFMNAKVLVEGLKRSGKNLTRDTFIKSIESIREFDLGISNPLSFSDTDHQGLEKVYFTHIEKGKFVLVRPL